MTRDEQIAQARRHVETGLRIIDRQRDIVARQAMPFSIDLLERFERIQRIFESDLADLLRKK